MSQFVVSARKYRPLRFDDVVGQSHVTTTLKNAIAQNTLAHAFLFCGPRGVGKTTCARILAKVLNCQNVGEDTEPCGTCDSCRTFDKNASLNILELDAASNNSVEHIRTLTEQVRFQPQEGSHKIFIIDEVHMLSQQAFNAFLKTLEEPPSYAVFILATTEKHKIIPTILSRCQIFDFKRIQPEDMIRQLEKVCREENIEADQDALHLIANKADGALRDALSIFDKLASYAKGKITYQDVINNLNILDYDYFFQVVDAFFRCDIGEVLRLFDDVQKRGFEGDIFVSGLAEHLRNLLVCKYENIHHLLDLSENLAKRYFQQAALADESFIVSSLDLLNTCDIEYKMAKNKRLHVEMTMIKLNYALHLVSNGMPAEKKSPDEPMISTEVPDSDQASEHDKINTKAEDDGTVGGPLRDEDMESILDPQSAEIDEPESTVISDVEGQMQDHPDQAPSFQLKKPSGLTLPAMPTLDQIEKVAAQRIADHEKVVSQVVSLEQVSKIWHDYAHAQPSQTVRTVLERVELDVKNNAIVATVGSGISKTVILQEMALIETLRKSLGLPKLTIKIEIDETVAGTNSSPKILTTKEKFELLCQQNPHFKTFQQQFGLQLDHE